MNREKLFETHLSTCADALDLMKVKNRDYGGDSDPFRNFRRWGLLGVLVRMGDKLARLETFVETGTLSVVEESADDCVKDIINYAILFMGMKSEMTHANTKGSGIGNNQEQGPTRTAEPRPGPLRANPRARDFGGDSRGARRVTPAETWSPADVISHGFTVGASPSGGRRKPVGRKSRRRKVTR